MLGFTFHRSPNIEGNSHEHRRATTATRSICRSPGSTTTRTSDALPGDATDDRHQAIRSSCATHNSPRLTVRVFRSNEPAGRRESRRHSQLRHPDERHHLRKSPGHFTALKIKRSSCRRWITRRTFSLNCVSFISSHLSAGFGFYGRACAQVAPIDVGAKVFAADGAGGGALDIDATICGYLAGTCLPLTDDYRRNSQRLRQSPTSPPLLQVRFQVHEGILTNRKTHVNNAS